MNASPSSVLDLKSEHLENLFKVRRIRTSGKIFEERRQWQGFGRELERSRRFLSVVDQKINLDLVLIQLLIFTVINQFQPRRAYINWSG